MPRIATLTNRLRRVSDWVHVHANSEAPRFFLGFFTIANELVKRAESLDSWIGQRLEGDDFARSHAGWVALREARTFFHPELKVRVAAVHEVIHEYANAHHDAGGTRGSQPNSGLARQHAKP